MLTSRFNTTILSACILSLFVVSLFLWSPLYHSSQDAGALSPQDGRPLYPHNRPTERPIESAPTARLKQAQAIIRKANKVAESPIEAPYKDKFAALGHLARSSRKWVQFLDAAPKSEDTHVLQESIEGAIATLFPYLLHSPRHPGSTTPFSDLRDSFHKGSRGIVIPTGKSTMRFAAHLISAVQNVLKSDLPIMVVYAGDTDFPKAEREKLQSRFKNVAFMDILTVVDDSTLKLEKGGWAIKAFAALYAPFEEVILADADCVFAQQPEVLYKHPLYAETGALLFHDRLLWQHAFRDRHEWWQSQIEHPSATLNKSLVWTEDYAEEGDSGIVVLDKGRLDVLMGLLHIAWQNTKDVRDEVTYKLGHGDKESWWFGLELTGANYAFEKHYGAMIGWPSTDDTKEGEYKVCSFYIGHVDAEDQLLWYNGGLLKNKQVDALEFGQPTHLMFDGTWHKGGNKAKESCMDGSRAKEIPEEVKAIFEQSVTLAKELDTELGLV
ncbi:hypothetical protein CC79DRAFT_1340172 [Sarocladium strictum]